MNTRTRNMTQSAFFMALGIVFPILFHATGLGSIFLPMFWPLAISAFYLPLGYTIIVGLFTPVISMLLTGMPPIPIVFIMMIEITMMMVTIYFIKKWTLLGSFPMLIIAMFMSRLALFPCILIFGKLLGITNTTLSWAFLIKGTPGVVTMIILIPILIYFIKKESFLWRKPNVASS